MKPSLRKLIDRVGALNDELAQAKKELRSELLKANGGDSVSLLGDFYEAKLVSYVRVSEDWKKLAESFKPSPQKLAAYKKSANRKDVRVSALKEVA